MISERQKETLTNLVIAVVISWVVLLFGPFLMLLVPAIFGVAVINANAKYRKHAESGFAIIALFIVIFLWGTHPFYTIGRLLSDNYFFAQVLGFFGALLLIFLILKLSLTQIAIGYIPLIMLICFPFIASMLLGFFLNNNIFDLREGDTIKRLDLTVLIFQSLASIFIVSTLKNDNSPA